MKNARVSCGAIALFSLGITALLIHFTIAREVWLDEFHTVLLSQMSWTELFQYVMGDVHPPAYFMLAKAWVALVGATAVSPRYFSILIHLLGTVVFFRLLRTRFSAPFIQFIGTTLFVSSPALFYYASEERSYSLAVLWSTIVIAFAMRILRQRDEVTLAPTEKTLSRHEWETSVALGALLAAGFYIHYMNVFVAAGVVLGMFASRTSLKGSAITSTVFLALCAPWIPITMAQRQVKEGLEAAKAAALSNPEALSFASVTNDGVGTIQLVRSLLENVASIAGMLPVGPLHVVAALAAPIVIVAVLVIASSASPQHRPPFLLALIVTSTTLLGLICMRTFERRYMLAIAPFVVLAIVNGLDWLRTKQHRRAVIAIGIATLAIYLAGCIRIAFAPYDKPLMQLTAYLDDHSQPGDIVVFNALYGEVPFKFMAAGPSAQLERRGFPVSVTDWWNSQPFKGWGSPVILRSDVTRFITGLQKDSKSKRVWVIEFDTHWYDPNEQLIGGLRAHGAEVSAITKEPFSDSEYQLYFVKLSD